jgi:hypothetical protein
MPEFDPEETLARALRAEVPGRLAPPAPRELKDIAARVGRDYESGGRRGAAREFACAALLFALVLLPVVAMPAQTELARRLDDPRILVALRTALSRSSELLLKGESHE